MNQQAVVGEFLKKRSSRVPTFWRPLSDGCVPSEPKSDRVSGYGLECRAKYS
ncbi:hypothetical protein [Micromonospora olivasterospora]|uniref:hypothetical protein n=1 Tax=Micromonospora olivasterospora TaxID=1880 RepID=UPI0014789CAA|nr:hypothetical protein [Micromonospora olivasterospora]